MSEQFSAWSTRPGRRTGLSVPARITWKDNSGAVRFTSVRAHEVTETGAVVECDASVSLPLFRLVHLQIEKGVRDSMELPQPLKEGRVLSAVWQVAPCQPSTGTPAGYALRFMSGMAGRADADAARRAS